MSEIIYIFTLVIIGATLILAVAYFIDFIANKFGDKK